MPYATITYTCRLCGKPVEAKYEATMVHKLEHWAPMLHCNRCADFKVALRNLRESCKNLTILRWTLNQNLKLTKEREDAIHSEMTSLTKAIAKLVCEHWRVGTIWEQDFATQILDFPGKAEFIVNQYTRMVTDAARQSPK